MQSNPRLWYPNIMMDADLKTLFKAWCGRHGYTPVRSVDVLSPVGSADLRKSRGRWSVTVAVPFPANQMHYYETPPVHGWRYPLRDASPHEARLFLES